MAKVASFPGLPLPLLSLLLLHNNVHVDTQGSVYYCLQNIRRGRGRTRLDKKVGMKIILLTVSTQFSFESVLMLMLLIRRTLTGCLCPGEREKKVSITAEPRKPAFIRRLPFFEGQKYISIDNVHYGTRKVPFTIVYLH